MSERVHRSLGRFQPRARHAERVEDSAVLRVLVQALVTIGILSVAVAAAGVTSTSAGNLLAIPLSAIGAYWSWRQRRRRNLAVKFGIAIGMLAALAVFLTRLLAQPGDTRIVLAELLIQLLVLHSFDLPRRKDLGYSMVIGLILLGVAATISQTLAFAPLLLAFWLLALPVLVLDYQSRLGKSLRSWRDLGRMVAWPRLGGVLLVTLALGLAIFAVLPRLPGYQIRNFPISATIDVDADFDGRAIVNPGYTNPGRGTDEDTGAGGGGFEEGGEGTGMATGPGQLDDTAYYGFNQQMNQNLRGTLTPQVVMRVRSQAEGFWRVLAFDHYTGQGWEISRNDSVQTLERSQLSYQTVLPIRFNRGQSREVIQTYTVVDTLPNLIPALYQPSELYFPTREVAIDTEAGLRSPIPLQAGLTYTVISRVPDRDRTRLGQADTTYSEAIRRHYLQVPPAIRQRVRQQAEALLATAPNPIESPYEQALFLAQALKQRYTLQPELPFFGAQQDLVEAFLFTYEGGYPDHFSTTLTVLLRSLGIPARLVVGFGPGEFNPFTGFYVVRNTDAYAMTEVYFPDYGWFAFDPIPGHPLLPPSPKEYEPLSVLKQFWRWVAGWLPSPVAGALNGMLRHIGQVIADALGWFQAMGQGWIGLLWRAVALVGLGFFGWLAWAVGRWGWRHWQWQRLPPVEAVYRRLLVWLHHQGWPKQAHETPIEYAQRLQHILPTQQGQGVATILWAYAHWRYGGLPQNVAVLQATLRSLRRRQNRRRRVNVSP
ncbi:transglutaminase TgpA family protein [Halomicronema hongdechloris]